MSSSAETDSPLTFTGAYFLTQFRIESKDHALEILGKRIRGLAAKYYAAVQTLTSKLHIFSDELHDDSNSYYVYFQSEDSGPYNMSLFDLFTLKRFARQEIMYALVYNELKVKNGKDEYLTDFLVEDNYDKHWDNYDDS